MPDVDESSGLYACAGVHSTVETAGMIREGNGVVAHVNHTLSGPE